MAGVTDQSQVYQCGGRSLDGAKRLAEAEVLQFCVYFLVRCTGWIRWQQSEQVKLPGQLVAFFGWHRARLCLWKA